MLSDGFTDRDARIVDLIVGDWREHVAPLFRDNCCIAASSIAVEALTYFGITAKVAAADVTVYNAVAWPLVNAGVAPGDWPPEAWSVGCSHDVPSGLPGAYDGHVVVIIGADEIVLDLTANQLHRPRRGILVPGPLVAPLDPALPGGVVLMGSLDARIVYRFRPEHRRWKQSPDHKRAGRMAGAMIRRVRSQLES